MVRCPACGAVDKGYHRFCTTCGGRLSTAEMAGENQPEIADRRIVTVIFAEISGVQPEAGPTETSHEVLGGLQQILGDIVHRFGGIVDKYFGEIVMAVFGAPDAHEDDAERAVAAAWEMLEATNRYARAVQTKVGLRPSVRLGLKTGLVGGSIRVAC